MKTLITSIILLFFQYSWASQIVLSVGEEKKISNSQVQRVWIEKKGLVKVIASGSALKIRGLKPGTTQIKFGNEHSEVHVLSYLQLTGYQNLVKLKEKIVGLEFELRDGQIEILGSLFNKKYYDEVRKALAGQSFVIGAQMPLQVEKEILSEVQGQLRKKNLPVIYIQRNPQWQIYLPKSDSRIQEYKSALEPYGVAVFADNSAISSQPLIRVQVTVAEVKREFSRKWGIQWPESIKAQVLPELAQGFHPADAQLNFLENRGHGKVLASPTLLVKSGEEASFHAGGEIPIKIVNIRSQNVEWKSYGIELKIKPKSDLSGRIELDIDTKVSNIIAAGGIDGIPALSTHRVKSTFSINEPRTIILSGLIRNEDSKTSQGLPGLGQLPILGSLFASKDFRENRSELLIFVRPEIVHEQTPFQHEHLPEAL